MLQNSCKCQRALFPFCNFDLGLIAVPINCMLGTNGNCSYDYANPKNYAFPNNICKVQEQQVKTRSSTVPWYRQVESSSGKVHGTDTQRQEAAHFHCTVPWFRSNTYGQVVVKFKGTGEHDIETGCGTVPWYRQIETRSGTSIVRLQSYNG